MADFRTLDNIIKLVSVEYLPPMLAAFIVGVVFSGGITRHLQIIFGLISVTFLVFGFNSYNAIYDKDIDRINKPTRPLPSGRLNNRKAFNMTILFFLISLIFGLLINYTFLLIDFVGIGLAVLYSHPSTYLKRHYFVSTMIGNLTFAVIYPLEGWSINTSFAIPWYIILFLLFIGFGTSALKDFEDIAGDKKNNIGTLAVKHGHNNAAKLVALIFFCSLLIVLGLIVFRIFDIRYIVLSVFIIIATFNAFFLSKDERKHISRKAFIFGVTLLTLVCICLIMLKLL